MCKILHSKIKPQHSSLVIQTEPLSTHMNGLTFDELRLLILNKENAAR